MAEDHQTKNANALVKKNAALLVPDNQVVKNLVNEIITLVPDNTRKKTLSENIVKLAERDSDIRIAKEIIKLIEK